MYVLETVLGAMLGQGSSQNSVINLVIKSAFFGSHMGHDVRSSVVTFGITA